MLIKDTRQCFGVFVVVVVLGGGGEVVGFLGFWFFFS